MIHLFKKASSAQRWKFFTASGLVLVLFEVVGFQVDAGQTGRSVWNYLLAATLSVAVTYWVVWFFFSIVRTASRPIICNRDVATQNNPQAQFNYQTSDTCGRLEELQHLLGRREVDSGGFTYGNTYRGRVVLISGAGGSIGSELCHQIIASNPRKLILYEMSETALYQINQAMLLKGQGVEIVPVLGSVADAAKVRSVLIAHGVQVVIHAAAYKHVPLVESNPLAGVQNNVFGTNAIANASVEVGIERFILISTDKAVRPTSVMGASKRLAELLVKEIAQSCANNAGPILSIVRFGNVLGSSGSVVPLFQQQVRRGGPVTVTHPDASRFFMTVQEAVQLVLCAGSMARGGETFVLDMGQPVNIANLARQVIDTECLNTQDVINSADNIEIKFTGLRPGEKLAEELTLNGVLSCTNHPKVFVATEDDHSQMKMATALKFLSRAISNNDATAVREQVFRWVEPYCARQALQTQTASG